MVQKKCLKPLICLILFSNVLSNFLYCCLLTYILSRIEKYKVIFAYDIILSNFGMLGVNFVVIFKNKNFLTIKKFSRSQRMSLFQAHRKRHLICYCLLLIFFGGGGEGVIGFLNGSQN